MDFAGLNYLAILVAAIAAFMFGAIYYGALGKPWMKAARIKPEDARMEPSLFITSFLAELIMAWVLAGVIGHLGAGQVTFWNGVVSGASSGSASWPRPLLSTSAMKALAGT